MPVPTLPSPPPPSPAWELLDAGARSGPHDDAAVVERIGRGLSPLARIRPIGTEAWTPVGAHPAFALALDAALGRLRSELDAARRRSTCAWRDAVLSGLSDLSTGVLLFWLILMTWLLLCGDSPPALD